MISKRAMAAALAGLLIFAASAHVARADETDNPRYLAWANFKVGSTSTLSGQIVIGTMQIPTEIKSTLKEVADDHVTIEVVMSSTINGESHDASPVTHVLKAKVDTKDVKDLGPEDVEAMGKTFKCEMFSGVLEGSSESKVWTNKEVPGGLVKMELSMHRPGAAADAGKPTSFVLKDFSAK